MALLSFYQHMVQPLEVSQGRELSNGDYIQGSQRWGCPIACDAVPSGKAEEKVFDDGVIRKYVFTCYLDANCREFTIGEKVRLMREGKEYVLEVKGFMRYQLQSKLWLGWEL